MRKRLGSSPSREVRDDPARLGPLDREHRVVVQGVLEADVEGLRLLAEPRQVLLVVGRVRDRQVVVLTELVGEEVVQDAPVLLAQHAVLRAAVGDLGDVVGEDALQEVLRACGPVVSISPMCETSKTPALVRTARCSSLMPVYWTGISQPANGTSLAPGGDVAVVERGFQQCGIGPDGHAAPDPSARGPRTARRRTPPRRDRRARAAAHSPRVIGRSADDREVSGGTAECRDRRRGSRASRAGARRCAGCGHADRGCAPPARPAGRRGRSPWR